MSPPPPHEIPTDILYEILLQYGVKNLSFLWLNCRAVSRNFKDAVEHVFVTKHLKKTWLHVGVDKYDAYVKLQFDHLDSTDPSRAVFESSECQDRLKPVLGNGLSLEHPNVIIQVRHGANDTMLPDFRYHFDPDLDVKFEVSFDWKGMYCHFFREQKEVRMRFNERQNFIMTQSPFWMFYMFRSMFLGVDESRISRDVRRRRISRNVLENEGREVSGDDELGFRKLKNKKDLAVQECPYSDESDEDEDSETDGSQEDRSEDDEGADDSDAEDEDEDSEVDVSSEDDDEDSNDFDSDD
ncbi:hypothetical protein EV421DRAFT_1801607 [Armillaria borealis]|uniref:F-box domain-containing protein n=1 Tax=Armillaria borealis TaxID=47425 RepID=A0AA39JJX8_9AGAR|nr:hypothetical protein EV421DRAFT_1801607 [Armillaria borealis]